MQEPLTLSCGHTFCRNCAATSLDRANKKCPTCRSPCHLDARSHPENVLINTLLKTYFVEQHEARLVEAARSREAWQQILPVFFMNVRMSVLLCTDSVFLQSVVFPGGSISLHFFEPRYRLMMRRIMDGNKRFCYLPNFGDYRASVDDVGVIAQVVECEFLYDGRALVHAKIVDRVRVVEQW